MPNCIQKLHHEEGNTFKGISLQILERYESSADIISVGHNIFLTGKLWYHTNLTIADHMHTL
jgi:hypothetical protein